MEIYVKCPNKGFSLNKEDVQYYFNFLDDLKESGSTNMFGAPKHLVECFEMCFKEASWIVGLWMHWVQHGEMKDTISADTKPVRYTHDFNFNFSVQSDFLNPDSISPEIIVDRFLETVRNMDRQEIFERSECYNSFEEKNND